MGYLEVFEREAGRRAIYGVSSQDSDAVKIYMIECLLGLDVSDAAKSQLNYLHSKHNLIDPTCDTPTPPPSSSSVYWGVGEPTPTTSAEVLAMSSAPLVDDEFSLFTGDVETKFKVVVPPGKTLTSVIDYQGANVDVVGQYVDLGTISVDEGEGPQDWTLYVMTTAIAYKETHEHRATVKQY